MNMAEFPGDAVVAARNAAADWFAGIGFPNHAAEVRDGYTRCDAIPIAVTAILSERERCAKIQIALNDAIAFAIETGGVEFLKAWAEGDWSTVADEWPDFDMASTDASGARS